MKISILNDNRTSDNRYCCEHGLSVHVSLAGESYLFDTGQTDKFVRNAQTLGIELPAVDAIVLSHGHYDHAGGLPSFPVSDRLVPLYMGAGATVRRYSLSSVMVKPNGFPQPEALCRFDVHSIDGVMNVGQHLTLFTLPCVAPANPKLVVDGPDGSLVPDGFADEVFALLTEGETKVLFGGCTHHGLEQLLTFCTTELGVECLSAFIGGLHLSGRSKEQIADAARVARSILPVGRWIVNHCTGDDAIACWESEFGSCPADGYAGSQIVL